MEPLNFFQQWFSRCPSDSTLTLSYLKNKRCISRHYTLDDLEHFVENGLKYGQEYNTFFSVSPTSLPLKSSARGSNKQVASMPGFYVDIDLRDPSAHVQKALPKDLSEVRKLIDDHLPPVSAMVFTGHGVHLYYLLTAAMIITDEAVRKKAEAYQGAFYEFVREKFSQKGWKIDKCCDLARMMRFPGSLNLKDPDQIVPCHVLELSQSIYTLSDFEVYLPVNNDASPVCEHTAKPLPPVPSRTKKSEYVKTGSADRIFEQCPVIRYLKDHPDEQTEPLWKAAIDNISLASDGMQKCHEFSEGYSGYSVEETEAKIQRALESRKPCTCEHFRSLGSHCPQEGCGVKAPIVFALPTMLEQIHELLNQEKLDAGEMLQERNLKLLAEAKEFHPAEYAYLKLKLKKTGLSMRDLERAIEKIRWENRNISVSARDDFDVEPSEISIDGIDLHGAMEPDGYSVTSEEGIVSSHFHRGEMHYATLCSRPVVITRIMENIDTGQERMELAFIRNDRLKHLKAPRADLLHKNALVKYANTGLPVSSDNSDGVVRYLIAYENTNEDVIPVIRSIERIGWLAGWKEFFPCSYEGEILFEDEDQEIVKGLCEMGDYALWKQTALKVRENTIARAILDASAASPLLELLKLRIIMMHNWFTSRSGKTAALKFAISLWGDPERLIGNFNSTLVGFERRAAILKHLPLGIDELQEISQNLSPSQIVYQLGNGQGKTRGARAGGLQETPRWRCSILTTGEQPLTSDNTMDGVMSRSIEIYGAPIEDPEFGRMVHQVSEANYGFAGKKYIEYLIKHVIHNKGKIQADFQSMRDTLKTSFEKLELGNAGPHLDSVALICLADRYISEAIFEEGYAAYDYLDIPSSVIIEDAIRVGLTLLKNIKSQEKEDSIERAWSFVEGWVSSNRRSFTETALVRYGKLESDRVYIIVNVLREALEKAGFSYGKCIKGFLDRGYLESFQDGSKKGSHQVQKKINGINNRVVCAHIDVSTPEVDQSDFLGFISPAS